MAQGLSLNLQENIEDDLDQLGKEIILFAKLSESKEMVTALRKQIASIKRKIRR